MTESKKHLETLWIVLLPLLLISCLSPYSGGGGEEPIEPGETSVEAANELFKIQPDDPSDPTDLRSTYRFYLTDSKYSTARGYTFWTEIAGNTTALTGDGRTVTVWKNSGNADAGYGIIFSRQRREDKTIMLTLMITKDGKYAVGKVVNGDYTIIREWLPAKTDSDGDGNSVYCLNEGYGVKNDIKVTYNNDPLDPAPYKIYFNGTFTDSFADVTEPASLRCNGYGGNGYVAVVGITDLLDNSPVETCFRE